MKKCPLCQREIKDKETQKTVREILEVLGKAISLALLSYKKPRKNLGKKITAC